MLRKTDANTAAIVNRYPRRAGGSINERVEQRPVRDGIAAVEHAFGFAIGRCDRAGIEMIAADHDRRFDFTAPDQFVHRDAKLGPFPIAEPANSCR